MCLQICIIWEIMNNVSFDIGLVLAYSAVYSLKAATGEKQASAEHSEGRMVK